MASSVTNLETSKSVVSNQLSTKQTIVIAAFFRKCFCARWAVDEAMSDSDENVYELENGHVPQDDESYHDENSSSSDTGARL